MEVEVSAPQQGTIPAHAPPRRSAPQRRSSLAEYGESLLVTVLLALFGTTFIVQAFKIPSQSMEPTLLIGDHLLVYKFPFDDHPHYVKRVVGLPGDRVRIINQHVYVNGDLLNEPYVVHDAAYQDPFGDNFPPAGRYFAEIGIRPEWAEQILSHVHHGELVVPPDNYFVMGDNRDRSWDSRYWGFVDRSAVMGRPVMIYWSVEATPLDYARRDFL